MHSLALPERLFKVGNKRPFSLFTSSYSSNSYSISKRATATFLFLRILIHFLKHLNFLTPDRNNRFKLMKNLNEHNLLKYSKF